MPSSPGLKPQTSFPEYPQGNENALSPTEQHPSKEGTDLDTELRIKGRQIAPQPTLKDTMQNPNENGNSQLKGTYSQEPCPTAT